MKLFHGTRDINTCNLYYNPDFNNYKHIFNRLSNNTVLLQSVSAYIDKRNDS
jgi:hypothetical protein